MSPSDTSQNAPVPVPPPKHSGRRWWLLIPVLALVALVVLVALIPVWLSTSSGRTFLVSKANQALDPARMEVDRFSWSWFGPTRMHGLRILNAQGGVVVSAPEATWDRNLRQAIFEPLNLGTLELPGAAIAIQQDASGSIDLIESLKPVLGRDPHTHLALRITQGSLTLNSPKLIEPMVAQKLEVELDKRSIPAPARFKVELASAGHAGRTPSLKIQGQAETPAEVKSENDPADIDLELEGTDWPVGLAATASAPQVRLNYTGALKAHRKNNALQTDGTAKLADIDLEHGPLKGGDHLKLAEPLNARWNLTQTTKGWDLSTLSLDGKELALKGQGSVPAEGSQPLKLEGRLDLAAFAAQLKQTLNLKEELRFERGTLNYGLSATNQANQPGTTWTATGEIHDLSAQRGETRLTLSEPLKLNATLSQRPTDWALDEFGLALKGVTASGSGDVDKGVSVDGTIDLAALDPPVRELVGLSDHSIAGAGPFSLRYGRVPGQPAYHAAIKTQLEASVPRQGPAPPAANPAAAPGDVPAPPAPGFPAPPAPGMDDAPFGFDKRVFLVDATLDGPSNPAGWPSGWAGGQGTLNIDQAELKAQGSFATTTNAEGRPKAVTAKLTGVAPVKDTRVGLDLSLAARLQADDWKIQEARLKVDPVAIGQPANAGATPIIDLALQGTYSPAQKRLQLIPAGPETDLNSGLTLAREGLNVEGVGDKNWKASVALEGDAAGLNGLLTSSDPKAGASPSPALTGRWTGRIETQSRSDKPGWIFSLKSQSQDLALVRTDGQPQRLGPITIEALLNASENGQTIDLPSLSVDSRFARVEAKGALTDPTSRRVIDLDGQLALKWAEVNALLADTVGPDTRISGRSRPFYVRGALPGGKAPATPPLAAELGIDLETLQSQGLILGPTPLVVKLENGRIELGPVDTTLNGGRIVLNPRVDQDPAGRWVLTLGPGSGIENAELNESMTHNVLAFVAPPLDNASRISGKVSAAFDDLSIPLGEGASEDAVVNGQVLFHDVVFAPGPMALQIYQALNIPPAIIRLDQPVSLAIHDGVVEQRGFSFPLGDAGSVTLDGNVAFDRSIDLIGTIGLAGERFQQVPVFNQIAPALRMEVPIRGTLQEPKLDGKEMARGLGRMGLNVAAGAGLGGLGALFDLINKPPLSPEDAARQQAEREARRQQQRLRQQQQQEERRLKREERRQMRGFP